jgi:mono/diheme cytochrome c family protein
MILRIALVALLGSLISPALAAGDPDMGRQLAERWCASCHVIEPSNRASDAVPSFPSLAEQARKNPSWTKAWLTAPHPPMEGIQLSRREIDDIVAYLQTLPPE